MDENNLIKISNIIINFFMINLLLFGFIGNFLSFKIFKWTKLNKYPISVYFKTISIFDSFILLEGLNFFIKSNFGVYFGQINDFFCKVDYYFTYATSSMSPWLMVIVSFDRFINIAFPKRFLLLHKITTQLGIIFFVVLLNCVMYTFLLWKSSIVSCNFIKTLILIIEFVKLIC